jgi:glycine/D-amino acid oxidase-like deaminating enzyme
MNRRSLLQLFGGVAVAGIPRLGAQRPSRVVVAGAGIVGANIAYQLARRGADVAVIERDTPGGGATSKSFAWINSTFSKQPWAYFYLNRLGMQGWRHLEREVDALPVRWGGSIEWYATEKEAHELAEQVRRHQAWGYPVRRVDERALRSLEPSLQFASVKGASHSEDEGHVDPVKATEVILAAAVKQGARVVPKSTVAGLDLRGDRLQAVRTSTGDVPADVLVVACGVDTPRVAAFANVRVPLKESPGVLVHTAPQRSLLNRVVLAPGAHMKQKPDGRIVTGVGFGGTPTKDSSREGGELFLRTAASGVLPDLAKADLETVTLGYRPLPQDEYPIVGFAPGRRDLYIAVMHSGVTLSPFIGRAAAAEILDDIDVEPLAPYRLRRFGN